MSINKIMSKQLNHGYNIQKMQNKIKQEPVVKMSVGKKILNWFKSKFSRFSKKADEFVDKFIDKKSDDIINKISEKVGVK